VLLNGQGANKIETIKTVREATGLDLAQAKGLVDRVPIALVQGVTQQKAAAMAKRFEGVAPVQIVQGNVVVREVATSAPPPSWTGGKVFFTVFLASGLLGIIGVAAGSAMNQAKPAPAPVVESRGPDLQSLRDRLAKSVSDEEALHKRLDVFKDVHLIRIGNACGEPLKVAVRYKGFDGIWVTQGWWNIKAGDTVLVGTTPNPDFYVAVEDSQQRWWSNDEGKRHRIDVSTDQPFTYFGTSPASDANGAASAIQSSVATIALHADSSRDVATRVCE
jgi:hypothetical protein